MTRTCRALHQSGARYLLQGDIKIWSPEQLDSLCQYISRDVASRSCYIRGLDLRVFAESLADPGKAVQTALFVTLFSEYAQNLETLNIAYTQPLATELPLVLSTLSRLRSLTLSAFSEDVEGLLERLQTPLRVLDISFTDNWSWEGVITADPAVVCAPLKDVLEVLEVNFVTFEASQVQYPRLTTLSVHGCKWAELEHIFHSFPNLANLSLSMLHDDDIEGLGDIEEHRALNVAARERGCWAGLRHLKSDPLSVYMLGVQSTVDTLNLASGGFLSNIRDCDRLRAVLTDTRPAILALNLRAPSALSTSKFGEVLAPAADRLTTLVASVETSGPPYTDPSTALVSINSVLLHTYSLCMPLEWNDCSAVEFQDRDPWHSRHLVLVATLR